MQPPVLSGVSDYQVVIATDPIQLGNQVKELLYDIDEWEGEWMLYGPASVAFPGKDSYPLFIQTLVRIEKTATQE